MRDMGFKFYLKNFFALVNIRSKTLLEYRVNAIGEFIISILSNVFSIVFIEILFSMTPEISGWNRYQMFLILAVFRIFQAIFSAFLLPGINNLSNLVRVGYLDMILLKPINAQFNVSFGAIAITRLLDLIPGFAILVYSLYGLNASLISYLFLLIGLFSGVLIFYSIYFIIATLTIWMGTFYSLEDFYYMMKEPLYIPFDFLRKPMSTILTFIIPLGFVVTVPAKVFLGKDPFYFSIISVCVAGILLFLSSWFWNFSLKHYTSASS